MIFESFNPNFNKVYQELVDAVNLGGTTERYRPRRLFSFLRSLNLTKGTARNGTYFPITVVLPKAIWSYGDPRPGVNTILIRIEDELSKHEAGNISIAGQLYETQTKGTYQINLYILEKVLRRDNCISVLRSIRELIDILEDFRSSEYALPGLIPKRNVKGEGSVTVYTLDHGEDQHFVNAEPYLVTDSRKKAVRLMKYLQSTEAFQCVYMEDKSMKEKEILPKEDLDSLFQILEEGRGESISPEELRLDDLGLTDVCRTDGQNSVFFSGHDDVLVINVSNNHEFNHHHHEIRIPTLQTKITHILVYALPMGIRRYVRANPQIKRVVFRGASSLEFVYFASVWVATLARMMGKYPTRDDIVDDDALMLENGVIVRPIRSFCMNYVSAFYEKILKESDTTTRIKKALGIPL